jgi:hypothetical protein
MQAARQNCSLIKTTLNIHPYNGSMIYKFMAHSFAIAATLLAFCWAPAYAASNDACTTAMGVATNVASNSTIDGTYAGLRLAHKTSNITVSICSSNCKVLSNNDSLNDYFVPARTLTEWLAFVNHHPKNVAVSNCAGSGTPGQCGTANGTAVSVAPSANLCTAGTASAIAGSGPWNWSCAGTSGGATAACSASLAPTNGACGSGTGY